MSTLMTMPPAMTAPQVEDENDRYGYITADYEKSVEGEQPDLETEIIRYDEQILAGLVTF